MSSSLACFCRQEHFKAGFVLKVDKGNVSLNAPFFEARPQKLQKVSISFVMSVCLSFRMEQLGPH